MKFARAPKVDPEINLIPLIDVFLVIIIFLMLTTTYSKFAQLQITLPSANAERRPERPNEINVAISASGRWQINGRSYLFRDVPSLAAELRRLGATMKDPVVIVSGDRAASYQSVIQVMDAARQAGYGQVAFAVEQAAK